MIVGLLAERLPQDRDVAGEPSLFHTRVTPDLLEQFVLREHAIAVLDENQQRLQDLWRQRHGFAVAQQESPVGVQGERSELVRGLAMARSWQPEQFRRKAKAACKDL